MTAKATCDAVLMIGFGGPTRAEQVRPFLDNVVRGRPIPRERYEEVVHHYDLLGGRSPYNDLTMRQAAALREELAKKGARVPVAVGMANWEPYVADSLRALAEGGARRVLGFIMAAHRSEASFERYQATVNDARAALGDGGARSRVSRAVARPSAVHRRRWRRARARRTRGWTSKMRSGVRLIFTAHSIPLAMAQAGPYVKQLTQSAWMVAAKLGIGTLETRVSKPQRQSARGVARTRHQGYASEPGREGGGGRADRFFVRSRRSAVRSRYRGGANRTRGGNQDGARADRRRPSVVYRDDGVDNRGVRARLTDRSREKLKRTPAHISKREFCFLSEPPFDKMRAKPRWMWVWMRVGWLKPCRRRPSGLQRSG